MRRRPPERTLTEQVPIRRPNERLPGTFASGPIRNPVISATGTPPDFGIARPAAAASSSATASIVLCNSRPVRSGTPRRSSSAARPETPDGDVHQSLTPGAAEGVAHNYRAAPETFADAAGGRIGIDGQRGSEILARHVGLVDLPALAAIKPCRVFGNQNTAIHPHDAARLPRRRISSMRRGSFPYCAAHFRAISDGSIERRSTMAPRLWTQIFCAITTIGSAIERTRVASRIIAAMSSPA